MQNLLVGIDLVEVNRFNNFDLDSRLAKNIFSENEVVILKKEKKSKESIAGRFAAKEAVKKTINENIKLNIIEILSSKSGRPYIKFLDKKIDKKYSSQISISHTKKQAIAICLTKFN